MSNLATSRSITFVDVETTHLDSKRSAILSISIITDDESGRQNVWSTKIKPLSVELEFADPEALKVCGYNDKEWEDAPSFNEVAETIAEKLAWGPIVGHNISFDIEHLTAAFNRRGWRPLKRSENFREVEKRYKFGYPLIDTCALAFLFLPAERQNLNALRDFYGIDKSRAHAADTDCEDCRTVFYNIIANKLDSGQPAAD
tara:strand:+ start:243 stop:845 length:603 start_codon:yes stop_codon:yes gene_type:complete